MYEESSELVQEHVNTIINRLYDRLAEQDKNPDDIFEETRKELRALNFLLTQKNGWYVAVHVKRHERQHLDIVLLDHDRAVFVNDHGVIMYQPATRTESNPIEGDTESMHYWMPNEAIQFAKAILDHQDELAAQQEVLEAMLNPLADYLLELLGEEKVKQHKYEWGWFMWEIGHLLTSLQLQKHPLVTPMWGKRMQDGFADNQLEALLEHTLHGKLRERYPLKVYIDEADQEQDEENEE